MPVIKKRELIKRLGLDVERMINGGGLPLCFVYIGILLLKRMGDHGR